MENQNYEHGGKVHFQSRTVLMKLCLCFVRDKHKQNNTRIKYDLNLYIQIKISKVMLHICLHFFWWTYEDKKHYMKQYVAWNETAKTKHIKNKSTNKNLWIWKQPLAAISMTSELYSNHRTAFPVGVLQAGTGLWTVLAALVSSTIFPLLEDFGEYQSNLVDKASTEKQWVVSAIIIIAKFKVAPRVEIKS